MVSPMYPVPYLAPTYLGSNTPTLSLSRTLEPNSRPLAAPDEAPEAHLDSLANLQAAITQSAACKGGGGWEEQNIAVARPTCVAPLGCG